MSPKPCLLLPAAHRPEALLFSAQAACQVAEGARRGEAGREATERRPLLCHSLRSSKATSARFTYLRTLSRAPLELPMSIQANAGSPTAPSHCSLCSRLWRGSVCQHLSVLRVFIPRFSALCHLMHTHRNSFFTPGWQQSHSSTQLGCPYNALVPVTQARRDMSSPLLDLDGIRSQ